MKCNRSVLRIFQVMDYLLSIRKGASLSEIASALSEPKTSVYDIITTAVQMNYLRKNNNLYFIGEQTKKAGKAYTEKQEILDIASPIILEASAKLNVSSSLIFLEKNTLNYAFTAHPNDAVLVARLDSPYGFIHASASGKVLLSQLAEAQRSKLISSLNYMSFTAKTITCPTALEAELKKVASQGYAIDDREFSYLLQCVGVPIMKHSQCIAAFSISSINLLVHNADEKIAEARRYASLLSELLSK